MNTASRPVLAVLSNKTLFDSFFTPELQEQLSQFFQWRRLSAPRLTPALRKRLSDVDGLITTWDSPALDETLLETSPRLRIIGHCGGEVKARFARPLFDRVIITNAAGPMAQQVAELAVTFLLYAVRNVDSYREQLRKPNNRIYQTLHLEGAKNETLVGRTVSMIGLGRIGRAVLELLKPFATRLVVYDPYVSLNKADSALVRMASLEEVLTASDLLLLTAALTPETRGMLNRKTLAKLRPGTWVINVARGGLIDLEALTREVIRGRLRCALDVTDPVEPLPPRHPLRRARGAVLTPHVGSISTGVRHAMAGVVLSDLRRFFEETSVENRVTAAMLDRMT